VDLIRGPLVGLAPGESPPRISSKPKLRPIFVPVMLAELLFIPTIRGSHRVWRTLASVSAVVCMVLGPRIAVAQIQFDEFRAAIIDGILQYHGINPQDLTRYSNNYNKGLQEWLVYADANNKEWYLGRIDPPDPPGQRGHRYRHFHIPIGLAPYAQGHQGYHQPDMRQLVLDFVSDEIKVKNWKRGIQGHFRAGDSDFKLCETINNSLEPIRQLPDRIVGSKKNPFVPSMYLGTVAVWGPYKDPGGAIQVGQIPKGVSALMTIPAPEAVALQLAHAAWNSETAQRLFHGLDKALGPYESWGILKSQRGNFRASGIGGFAGEVANQYGYGRAAAVIGLGADVVGGYSGGGLRGVGTNLGATGVQMATQLGVSYLGGNEMQSEGAGRLAGLATASLGGPQGAITYGVSTIGSDVGSIAASYASARRHGMSTSTFFGETVRNYKTYFWQYVGH